MHRVIFPFLGGLLAYVVTANAYTMRTGDGLLSLCTAQQNDKKAYCRGYIDAVVEYLVIERLGQKLPLCIPANITTEAIEDIVIDFLKSQRDARTAFSPSLIITMAIDTAWPCKRAQYDQGRSGGNDPARLHRLREPSGRRLL
jgi:hypothetical protein